MAVPLPPRHSTEIAPLLVKNLPPPPPHRRRNLLGLKLTRPDPGPSPSPRTRGQEKAQATRRLTTPRTNSAESTSGTGRERKATLSRARRHVANALSLAPPPSSRISISRHICLSAFGGVFLSSPALRGGLLRANAASSAEGR